MNKEIDDALHMLLHCSLKDTEYETQVEQYKIVRKYITNLQQENKKYKEVIDKLNKYLHIRGIKQCYNGKVYCGFDGLQANVFEDILKEVE